MRASTPAIRSSRGGPPLRACAHPRLRSVFFVVAALASALAAGCGGSPPPAKDSGGADLTDTGSAMAELNRAESEISALFGPTPEAAPSASAMPGQPSPPPVEPQAQPTAITKGAETGAGQSAQMSDQSDPCSVACRALASMERAANHLCGLSGEGDPTCTSARTRVKNATDRVSARCPCR